LAIAARSVKQEIKPFASIKLMDAQHETVLVFVIYLNAFNSRLAQKA